MLTIITQITVGFIILGFVGIATEKIGKAIESHRVEMIGSAIKSIASDAPGFIANLSSAVKGKK